MNIENTEVLHIMGYLSRNYGKSAIIITFEGMDDNTVERGLPVNRERVILRESGVVGGGARRT